MSFPELKSRNRLLSFLRKYFNGAGAIVGYSRYGAATLITDTTTTATVAYVEDGKSNKHSVTFRASPSGNVEIAATLTCLPGSNDSAQFALSDDGSTWATYTPIGALSDTQIVVLFTTTLNDYSLLTIYWTLTGLTPDEEYTFYLGFAAGGAGQTVNVYWGGVTSDLIMKATALPATIGAYP